MSEVALTPYAPARSRSAVGGGSWLRVVRKWLLISLGSLLVLVGMVGAVLPGHLGLPVMVVGLAVILRNSRGAKRSFLKLQRKHPNWVFPLRRLMRPKPEFARVFWHGFLRTERLILMKEWRVLKRLRRKLFLRHRR